MEECKIENAQIESVSIYAWGRFTMLALSLNYGVAQQGYQRRATIDLVRAIMDLVGAEKWEDVPGKYVRVKHTYAHISHLGNILTDKWLLDGEQGAEKE